MIVPNRILACKHIELEDGCHWCEVYKQQAFRECDRCHIPVRTDAVYLAIVDPRPQVICVGCHLWEMNARGIQ